MSCANYHVMFEPSVDSRGLIDVFEGEGYGREKKCIHKNNLPSNEYIKNCTKAVTFCFFDDFRSKNGLPASSDNGDGSPPPNLIRLTVHVCPPPRCIMNRGFTVCKYIVVL